MQKFRNLLLAVMLLASQAHAQTVNWATDIAPILYQHCVQCHRADGIGHFSLVGYDNAFTYRHSIQDATENKRMPPWKADPTYRHFVGENVLSDTEIQQIKTWVEQDAPPGDLAQAPAPPQFPTGSQIGMPDEILTTPIYTMTASEDEYRCFVLPNNLSQTAFLRGMEVIPGNHLAVHHVLIYEDTTGQARMLDAQTPEPGYANFGGTGVNGTRLVGAWVPGSRPSLFPPDMGFKLTPGADLVVQVHFPAAAFGMTEQTTINMFFTPTNQGIREVRSVPLINHSPLSLQDYPLSIQPNEVKTYYAKFRVPPGSTSSVISVGPHMHLIGQKIECFATTPAGDTLKLIRINDWDFHWQGAYTFQKLQKIPAGSVIHAYAMYDNTPNNPQNPSNPPQLVTQGEATTDEMLLVYFTFTAYQPGDENILLDSTLLTNALPFVPENTAFGDLRTSPNPASDFVAIEFNLLENTNLQISLLDAGGRVLRTFAERNHVAPGICREQINVRDLSPGTYFVRLQAGQSVKTAKFIKPG